MSLEVAAFSASALQIGKTLVKDYLQNHAKKQLTIKDIQKLAPQTDSEKELEELPPEQIDAIRRRIEEIQSNPSSDLSLRARARLVPTRSESQDLTNLNAVKPVGALALAVNPNAVFQDARRRISLASRSTWQFR